MSAGGVGGAEAGPTALPAPLCLRSILRACPDGEMAYAMGSKPIVRKDVRVRVPLRARFALTLGADERIHQCDLMTAGD